jgi:arylsulfatase A-like enzyme
MATCVDVAEATYPAERDGRAVLPLEGKSLKPLLVGQGEFAERTLFWEHEGNAAIRNGHRKLVRLGGTGDWELFDLKSDRTEQNNLASAYPEEVTALARQWQQWARAAHVLPKPAARRRSPK